MMAVKRSRKEADRLSDLPESLQLRILSCLDANDVVQTMVLSKSWVSKWASTPVLNFRNYDGFRNTRVFNKFVVGALSRRQPVKLDRITFKHGGKYCPKSIDFKHGAKYCPKSIENVFDYAFSHGVRKLKANIPYIKSWPIGLHTSSDSLTSLALLTQYPTDCLILKPRSGSFKNLTNLHLKSVRITDLDPFSGFPALDKLILELCFIKTKENALNVHATQLSECTLSCCNRHLSRCEFTTPKLRYFKWRGSNFPRLVTHEGGFPVLDTVVIDDNGYCPPNLARMMFDDMLMWFNTLHNARSLTLFSPVVELLTLFPVKGCSPFSKLKCLKLDLRPSRNLLRRPCRSELELLNLVPGLKAYLLPESHDAKFSVVVTDSLRP